MGSHELLTNDEEQHAILEAVKLCVNGGNQDNRVTPDGRPMAQPPRFVNAGSLPSVILRGHSRGETGQLLSINSCTRISSSTSKSTAGPILLVLIAGATDLVTTCRHGYVNRKSSDWQP